MKVYSRRAAAVVLAVAISLSVPTTTAARPQKRDDASTRSEIVRIIKKIQRMVGIAVNDDLPLPPPPPPVH